ncbi:MAG: RimK family alpha-L-glutamate ligase [Candidatus Woesearchaeota archaeon]
MKAAVISLGSVSSNKTAEAMREYFDEVDEITLREVELNFQGNHSEIMHQGKPLKEYDCIYAKGSFRYAALLRSITAIKFQECYMPLQPSAFTIVHDKLLTQLEFQQHGVSMPKTYLSATVPAAKKILKKLKYPIVMKFPQGTHGKGVMFADSAQSATTLLDAMDVLRQPVLVQEFIDTGGTDIRAFVIGDKVVAAMRRKGTKTDARANLHQGGKAELVELDPVTTQVAIKAAKAVGADIAGIDILESHRGPVVLEANISPGIQGITKVTKIDVAQKIAKYLYDRTKESRRSEHDVKADKIMRTLHIETGNTTHIVTNLDFRGM